LMMAVQSELADVVLTVESEQLGGKLAAGVIGNMPKSWAHVVATLHDKENCMSAMKAEILATEMTSSSHHLDVQERLIRCGLPVSSAEVERQLASLRKKEADMKNEADRQQAGAEKKAQKLAEYNRTAAGSDDDSFEGEEDEEEEEEDSPTPLRTPPAKKRTNSSSPPSTKKAKPSPKTAAQLQAAELKLDAKRFELNRVTAAAQKVKDAMKPPTTKPTKPASPATPKDPLTALLAEAKAVTAAPKSDGELPGN
jgi:hypothetical protein